jgi:hypothetical protein
MFIYATVLSPPPGDLGGCTRYGHKSAISRGDSYGSTSPQKMAVEMKKLKAF